MKKTKQIQVVRKWMRLHSIMTGMVFGVYFLAAFLYSPDFFVSDVVSKFHAIADTITLTAKVLSPPVKPVVTLVSTCTDGVLDTSLDWADDENSYTYDIFRDGSPLVTNLTSTQYQDLNVSIGSQHEYTVEVYGPMGAGFALSDAVSIVAPGVCAVVLPTPTVTTTSLDGINILGHSGTIRTTHQSFLLTGTTNMPLSVVNVTVSGGNIVSLQATANINGYWEVSVPASLTVGLYSITVTAIDNADVTRNATQILSLQIDQVVDVPTNTVPVVESPVNDSTKSGDGHHNKSKRKSNTAPTTLPVPLFKKVVPQATNALLPLDFRIVNAVASQSVLQGDSLAIDIEITTIDTQYQAKPARIRYSILDDSSYIVSSMDKDVTLSGKGSHIHESIKIPLDLKKGDYVMQVELLVDGFDIVRTTPFSVVELPLFTLGGGTIITYPQFVRNIGWLLLGSLFMSTGWLLLWIREYWLYLHATRYITEKHLSKKGFIPKRKGVSS